MDWSLHEQKLWKNKKTGVIAFLVVIQGPNGLRHGVIRLTLGNLKQVKLFWATIV